MSDYISREAMLEKAEYDGNYRLVVPVEAIKGLPAADAEPVRHGRWEEYIHSRYCGIDEYGEPIYRDVSTPPTMEERHLGIAIIGNMSRACPLTR